MASYNGDRSQTMLPPIWKKPLDSAIHLKVYRNGDGNFGGKTVTLNKKQQRTFDSWLGELSSSMKLRSGAVWRVFTPTAGHRVDDFETLEDGKMIVVAGQERFKPLRYAQIDPNPKKGTPKNYDVEPGHNKRFAVSGKSKKMDIQGKIIKIWANGNETHGPRTVLLPAQRSYRPESLDNVIATVSGVLCEECNGPVEKLYFTSGIKVMSMDQISPNQAYVACKKTEPFKRAHYKDSSAPHFRTSPRLERKLPPIPRSNKTSSQSSPEHSYRREKAKKEEEQVFHARPVKHKRSSEKNRQVDYDKDSGGVFKAKQQNKATRGARQVEDSGQTRTDLPLDRRPADTVQEEEVKDNKKDKKGKKDAEPERQYKSNARRATPPGEKEAAARREAELEARAKREAEDRERADKARQQREAQAQKRKDKEEAKRKEDEERKRKKEEEKEKREEERKRKEQEKEKKKGGDRKDKADKKDKKDTSMPDRNNKGDSARDAGSPRETHSRERDDDPGRASLASRPFSAEQRRLAEEEELAAARIQAGFRGYQTRRDLRLQQAEDSLERRHPLPLDRHHDDDDRRDDWGPGVDAEEEKAATTLQAGFRGYQARREVKAMRQK